MVLKVELTGAPVNVDVLSVVDHWFSTIKPGLCCFGKRCMRCSVVKAVYTLSVLTS